MATAAGIAADAVEHDLRFKSGPPRKRSKESRRARDRAYSRAYRTAHSDRRRVLSAESRRRRNHRMAGYLRWWRRRTGRCVSEHLVRLRWARVPDEVVFHLVPTLGKLSRKPPTPNHPICAMRARVTKLICPFRCQTPISRCPDCVAARDAWMRMVAAPSADHMPATAPAAMAGRTYGPAIAMTPQMAALLPLISFDMSGFSPAAPG